MTSNIQENINRIIEIVLDEILPFTDKNPINAEIQISFLVHIFLKSKRRKVKFNFEDI